jgi:hypothetical protein
LEIDWQNRFTEALASAARQVASVLMVFFGSVLASNAAAGPCGGTALAHEPFPAIFVCTLGIELILCSYFPVKSLKVESSFRAIVYVFLVLWSLSLLAPVVWIARAGLPKTSEDANDSIFFLLRGAVATINLFAFYRSSGVKKLITQSW